MEALEQEIAELEAILHEYTLAFLVFDVIFIAMFFLAVILGLKYVRFRKNLLQSDEYLLYTIRGQEEERSRISRELHDTVAQNLRYCKSLSEKKDAVKNLTEISSLLGKTLAQIRAMSYNLAPPDITRYDFAENLKNLCAEYSANSEIPVRLTILDGTDTSFLSKDDVQNLYRIAQESLNNSEKHSRAREVVVMLRNQMENEEKGIYLFISDDGTGFDYSGKIRGKPGHLGLTGMQKRADLISARLSVNSRPETGTQISVFKPAEGLAIHKWGGDEA